MTVLALTLINICVKCLGGQRNRQEGAHRLDKSVTCPSSQTAVNLTNCSQMHLTSRCCTLARTRTRCSTQLAGFLERTRLLTTNVPPRLDDDQSTARFGDFVPVLSESPYSVGVSHIPRKTSIPDHIALPSYARHPTGKPQASGKSSIIELGTPDELAIRRAARLARQALELGGRLVRVSCEHVRVSRPVEYLRM